MPPENPLDWPETAPPLTHAQRARIESELKAWDKQWALTEKKQSAARFRVSSRVLVYVDGGRHGYLLLHLAREPDGHDRATSNRRVMALWADIAEAFIHDGTILV